MDAQQDKEAKQQDGRDGPQERAPIQGLAVLEVRARHPRSEKERRDIEQEANANEHTAVPHEGSREELSEFLYNVF